MVRPETLVELISSKAKWRRGVLSASDLCYTRVRSAGIGNID